MSSKALSLLFSALLYAGCSVKEYREACPCRLLLDFNEVDTSLVRSADLFVTVPDGYVFADHVEADLFRKGYEAEVPRTRLWLNAVYGAEDMYSESGLKIPLGEDCPPVYMHSSYIHADCEMWREVVWMRKNHCRMTMNLKGEGGYMPELRIISDVCGYDVAGEPVKGRFECTAYPDYSGECCVVVPRQTDDVMMLEIDDGEGVVKSFALGTYIASTGYDWSDPDLKDIEIELDLAVTRITLLIRGWDDEYMFEIVI